MAEYNIDNDIVPGLLEAIKKRFDELKENDSKLTQLAKALDEGKATQQDAFFYAKEIGILRRKVLDELVTDDILPDGRMYYNIAERLFNNNLYEDYKLICDYCKAAFTQVNNNAGINIKGQIPEYNQNKTDGIIEIADRAEQYSNVRNEIGEAIETNSKGVYDDTVRANAKFQYSSGLKPTIIRTAVGKTCKWCSEVAGKYDYSDVSDSGNDVFRRHANCDCLVVYSPHKGIYQNVHGKRNQWMNDKEYKQELNLRKYNARKEEATKKFVNKKEQFESVKKYLSEEVGFASTNIDSSLMNIHEDVIQSLSKTLHNLEMKFGAVHDSANAKISQKTLGRSVLAGVSSRGGNANGQELSFGSMFRKSARDIISDERDSISRRWHMPCNDDDKTLLAYTVTHEYGHMLQNVLYTLGKERYGTIGIYSSRDTYTLNVKRAIIDIATRNNPLFRLEDNISKYGKATDAEFFAEVFANSQLGKPNELGVAMLEWLKEAGY